MICYFLTYLLATVVYSCRIWLTKALPATRGQIWELKTWLYCILIGIPDGADIDLVWLQKNRRFTCIGKYTFLLAPSNRKALNPTEIVQEERILRIICSNPSCNHRTRTRQVAWSSLFLVKIPVWFFPGDDLQNQKNKTTPERLLNALNFC